MMKKFLIAGLVVTAFAVMGFTGCDGEKSAAPTASDTAWCKTKYTDEASCSADSSCKWKPDETGRPAHCAGK